MPKEIDKEEGEEEELTKEEEYFVKYRSYLRGKFNLRTEVFESASFYELLTVHKKIDLERCTITELKHLKRRLLLEVRVMVI